MLRSNVRRSSSKTRSGNPSGTSGTILALGAALRARNVDVAAAKKLAPVEQLSRHQRTLMLAGALLHDIGYHIAHESHQRHALYLILNSELTGFSEVERSVIANIARYHRGALPKERHREYAALNAADRESVRKLGAIVRLADALDRSHDSRVSNVQCRVNGI